MLTPGIQLLPAKVCEVIRAHAAPDEEIFLVGGVVRDMLLNRPTHDIDLVMRGSSRSLARQVANALNGDFFMLDSERDTARVLCTLNGQRTVIDFAAFREETLEGDLRARDFTINSMALSLNDPHQLIDPLLGAQDLNNKVLRLSRPHALQEDPLRVLRAARFAVDLDCRLPAPIWSAMRAAAPGLEKVSAERKRDEIFRIFGGRNAATALSLLERAGALPFVFQGDLTLAPSRDALAGLPHTADPHGVRLNYLEELLDALGRGAPGQTVQNFTMGAAVLYLGRFRSALQEHLDGELSSGRTARQLLLLAGWLQGATGFQGEVLEPGSICTAQLQKGTAGKIAAQCGRALALSQVETRRLERLLAGQALLPSLSGQPEEVPPREIYCYFRKLGGAGIDLTLLGLADLRAAQRSALPPALWLERLTQVARLWEGWWERPSEWVNPPRLLSGDVLQSDLGIASGPRMGRALEAVREAQAEGSVASGADALVFLRNWLEDN